MNFSEDCALFIALTTAPLGKVKEQIEEIKAVFRGYKKKQDKFSEPIESRAGSTPTEEEITANKAFQQYFYEPQVYYMFGEYDLAIISLVDDFTLSNRNFHPYSYFIKEEFKDKQHSLNFRYQIITGTAPLIPDESEYQVFFDAKGGPAYDGSKLISKACDTFLKKPGEGLRYPFISITRIKLNNGLLIGAGAHLAGLVEIAIQKLFRQEQEKCRAGESDIVFDFIISESFSWHELTLTIFCNDYKYMCDLIVGLREMSLLDIGGALSHLFKEELAAVPENEENFYSILLLERAYRKAQDAGNLPEQEMLFQLIQIWKNNLVQHWIGSEKDTTKDVGQTHVFVKTVTALGYDPEVPGFITADAAITDHRDFYALQLQEELKLIGKWHVKPGHAKWLFEFNRKVSRLLRKDETAIKDRYYFVAGDADYIFSTSQHDLVKHWLTVRHFVDSKETDPNEDRISEHSRRIDTLPRVFYNSLAELLEVSNRFKYTNAVRASQHFFSNDQLRNNAISFSLSQLSKIREWLYKCKVSKILREKVLHMYVNFNDGVQDPLLFIYFIELRRFLEEVSGFIEKQSDPEVHKDEPDFYEYNLSELHTELDELVSMFEEAFTNRIHQSYLTDMVTDYNMEYNGGCQQILSALDALYKVSTSVFGDNVRYTSFAYVMGLTETKSNIYSLRLNYFHIFQPSMLLSLITKEAANFLESVDAYPYVADPLATPSAVDEAIEECIAFARPENQHVVLKNIYQVCARESDPGLRLLVQEYMPFFTVGDYEEQEVAWQDMGQIKEVQVSSNLLEYFKADILNYLYTYNLDSELFCYWYWNTWTEMSFERDRDGINPNNFVVFMIRIVLVLSYIDPDYLNKCKSPPSRQLAVLWSAHFENVRRCIAYLLEHCEDLKKWLKGIKVQGISLVTIDVARPFLWEIESGQIKIDDIIDFNLKSYPPLTATGSRGKGFMADCSDLFHELSSRIEYKSCLDLKLSYSDKMHKTLCEKLERGELNIFQHSHHRSGQTQPFDLKNNMVFYVHSYMYAYLKCLQKMNQDAAAGLTYNPVLFRTQQTGEVDHFKDLNDAETLRFVLGGLMFDPMGGLFTANKCIRRKHLRMRATLMRSLWDMSLKLKMHFFKDPLSQAAKSGSV